MTQHTTVIVFKGNETTVPYEEDDGTTWDRKPLAFRIPALAGGVVEGTEVLVTLCDARYNGWWDWDPIEMASKVSYGGYTQWGPAEIVVKNTRASSKAVVGDPTAVIKGNKAYVLVVSWDNSPGGWVWHGINKWWNPLMVVGNIKKASDDGRMYVEWNAPVSLKSLLPAMAGGSPGAQFLGGVGNGVVMRDGTIVFPLQVSNTAKQVMSSIMYSRDDGASWVVGSVTAAGPSECSVVEWGNGKLLLTTRVDNKPREMYETDDMGVTWKVFAPLSGVWGNQRDRKGPGCQAGFITVPVDDTEVMLLSLPLNPGGKYIRERLQLWMTDGQRVFHVGEISETGKGDRSGYSVLSFVNDTLYCFHEINPYDAKGNNAAPIYEWDRILALSELSSMMSTVRTQVREWKAVDAKLAGAGVSVNGLVGYLSESSASAAEWVDTYGCVNALVKNAEKVDGGFRFGGGADGGAQWPVISQGQNQRYYFTKSQFTIAATVLVHKTAEGSDTFVMGAISNLACCTPVVGLGFVSRQKWYVVYDRIGKFIINTPFKLNTEYHILLAYVNGRVSLYVDGVLAQRKISSHNRAAKVVHFFIGGHDINKQTHGSLTTVKNVVLYNRELSTEEVVLLFKHFVHKKDDTAIYDWTIGCNSSSLVTHGDANTNCVTNESASFDCWSCFADDQEYNDFDKARTKDTYLFYIAFGFIFLMGL